MEKIEIFEQNRSGEVLDSEKDALSIILNSDNYDPDKPDKLLGVDWCNRKQTVIQAKYYIGLKWIKEKEIYPHTHFIHNPQLLAGSMEVSVCWMQLLFYPDYFWASHPVACQG